MTALLLKAENLVKHFPVRTGLLGRQSGAVRAVDGVSFELAAGETLALVGESGCGKSTVGRLVLRLLEPSAGRVLFEDENLNALDARALREETGTAIILITHDLGVVAELADDVVVMYAGRIVERATVAALFAEPQHPYTVGLLGSIPRLDIEQDRLAAIEGQVPNPLAPVTGCRFHPRCPFVIERCRHEDPPLFDLGNGHQSACWRAPLHDNMATQG